MSTSLGDMNERMRQLERGVLDDMVARMKAMEAWNERMLDRRRRGHADPLTSDAEWAVELAERRAAHAALMAEIRRLDAAGIIIACDPDISCNEQRPTRWLHDETVEEWHARVPDWDQPVTFHVNGTEIEL